MRKFIASWIAVMILIVGSMVVISIPAQAATSLYQCIYKYYPYSELWTTNGQHANYLNTHGWSCVKWR